MMIYLILFTFSASNDNSSSENSRECERERGNCMCRTCLNIYMQNPDAREGDWERNEERKRKKKKNSKIDESCFRRLEKNIIKMFTGRSSTSESEE